MVKYITDIEQIDLSSLTEYVWAQDKDFVPSLSGRVNIDAWTEKVYKNGSVIIVLYERTVVGAIFFYANDELDKVGYISYLSVSRELRSQGIASELLALCFAKSRELGMTKIGVHTHNPKALRLYLRAGFDIKEQIHISGSDLLKTYLVKQL